MSNIKRLFFSILILPLSCFIRRKNNWLAFGSWQGKYYIDNSRYLFEYIRSVNNTLNLVWIGDKSVEKQIAPSDNVYVVRKNSLKSIVLLLKCKYMFCSQMHFEDLCDYNVYNKAVITYLHHGMPVKKWGADSAKTHISFDSKSGLKELIRTIIGSNIKYSFFATSSMKQIITNLSSLDYRGSSLDNNLPSGTPRNDFLLSVVKEDIMSFKKLYSQKIGFAHDKVIVLYLPTYRRSGKATFSFVDDTQNEIDSIVSLLKSKNAILIEKNHIAEDNNSKSAVNQIDNTIFHVNQDVNIQEILSFTDVLISDYSGAFLDYVLLDRPIIHFAYDYSEYKNEDSGLYYEIDEFAAGPVVSNVDGLLNAIEDAINNPDRYHELRKRISSSFMEYELGHASEYLYKRIVLSNNKD